jgi:hypothetical protein
VWAPTAAVVTEPTELAVATAHKGFVWTEIEVTGRAAHGSRPQLGVDAILKAGPILVALELFNRGLAARAHPLLGPGTLHGSLISGGREESTIPDRCVLTVERRTLPGETVADVEREIAEVLAACRSGDPALTVSARTTLARDPFETADSTPIVDAVATAAAGVLGTPAERGGVTYWADSAFISAAGIPTVLFGPTETARTPRSSGSASAGRSPVLRCSPPRPGTSASDHSRARDGRAARRRQHPPGPAAGPPTGGRARPRVPPAPARVPAVAAAPLADPSPVAGVGDVLLKDESDRFGVAGVQDPGRDLGDRANHPRPPGGPEAGRRQFGQPRPGRRTRCGATVPGL